MKTIEEMKKAVLAYCEEVCPNKSGPAPIDCGHLTFGYVEDDDVQMEAWMLFIGEDSPTITLYALSSEASWIAAYRILGLAERDAVAECENECTKRVWAKDDMAHHLLTKITELEARNTALVAAGKALVTAVKVGAPITESIIHQLVEFEKAIAANTSSNLPTVMATSEKCTLQAFVTPTTSANTEKGGVQG